MKASAWGLVALCALAANAHADPRDAAGAQALFDDAMALMKTRSFAKACPKLAESQRLDPGIGTQFHLAECYEGQGLIASAWAQFLEVASLAGAAGQADRQQAARKRAAKLESRLSRIKINVPAGRHVTGMIVERDGVAVREVSWDSPTPVDAGEHQITASAAGYKSFSTKVSVQEGQTAAVEIPQLEADPTAPANAPTPAAAPAPSAALAPTPAPTSAPASDTSAAASLTADNTSAPSSGLGPAVIGLGVLGIAGVGVGTVFGLMANSKFKDSKSHCLQANEDCCDDTGVKLRDDSITMATVSTIGFVAGGVGLVGAAIVLVARGGSKPAAGRSSGQLTTVVDASPTRATFAIQGELLMRPSSMPSRFASLAILALGGCTMVLGIHKAEKDDAGTAGTTTSTGTGGPGTGNKVCEKVATDCSSCLKSKCASETTDCLGQSECRQGLAAYTACLDGSCRDTQSCVENKITSVSLSLCMTTNCGNECTDSGAVVSGCELYCACMQSACTTLFSSALGDTAESCLAKCKTWSDVLPRDVKCRWKHCEFATLSAKDADFHCPHAAGTPQSQDVCVAVTPTKRNICGNGAETGFPCHAKEECCSQICTVNVCE